MIRGMSTRHTRWQTALKVWGERVWGPLSCCGSTSARMGKDHRLLWDNTSPLALALFYSAANKESSALHSFKWHMIDAHFHLGPSDPLAHAKMTSEGVTLKWRARHFSVTPFPHHSPFISNWELRENLEWNLGREEAPRVWVSVCVCVCEKWILVPKKHHAKAEQIVRGSFSIKKHVLNLSKTRGQTCDIGLSF